MFQVYKQRNIIYFQCDKIGYYNSECQNKVKEEKEEPTPIGVALHSIQQHTRGGFAMDKGKRVVDIKF